MSGTSPPDHGRSRPGPRASDDITVMLVDDHAVVRRGLRGFLRAVPGIEVVGEAGNGHEAVQELGRLAAFARVPDVVLMDLMMPRMGGIDAIAAIRSAHPDVRVVALTSYSEPQRVHAALEAGASGYVLKDAEADEVAAAVRAAARDEVHLDAAVARTLAMAMSVRRPVADLTSREREVLVLVARGKSNQDIADTLFISERTARTHVSHVIGKLGLQSRVQAALWALRNGLVTLE
jgi:DNA-binding NarL/FixJ family response regulator